MIKKFKYIIVPLLSLLAVVACKEEVPLLGPESLSGTYSVTSTEYDDAAGLYSVTLGLEGKTVSFVLSCQVQGLLAVSPTPLTGHYMSSSSTSTYAVESGAKWTDASGVEHSATDASVYVVAEGTSCRMNGVLTDASGNSVSFDCSGVTFAHSLPTIQALMAYGDSGEGYYILTMYSQTDMLMAAVELEEGQTELEAGYYDILEAYYYSQSAIVGVEGMIAVSRENGGYVIAAGVSSVEDAETQIDSRVYYTGALLPLDLLEPDLYTELSGDWTLTADKYYGYSSTSRSWSVIEEPYTANISMIGVPNHGSMLMRGLFGTSYLTVLQVQSSSALRIQCSHETNPVARLSSTSGSTYLLYICMYDPNSGYRYNSSLNNYVTFNISDDLSTITMQNRTSTASDGTPINYDYIGVYARNISANSYTRFTNFPFLYIPQLTRPGAETPSEAIKYAPVESEPGEPIVFTEDVTLDGIAEIVFLNPII